MPIIHREDLCDADGMGVEVAKVYFEWGQMGSKREAQYCGHHADLYMDKLIMLGADVLDTRQPPGH